MIDFFGFEIDNNVLYSYIIGSVTRLVLLNPILTSMADYSGRKKMFMKFFCYLETLSCVYFYFTKDNIAGAVIAFGLSMIG
jgi:UMF1 family MFS transporter